MQFKVIQAWKGLWCFSGIFHLVYCQLTITDILDLSHPSSWLMGWSTCDVFCTYLSSVFGKRHASHWHMNCLPSLSNNISVDITPRRFNRISCQGYRSWSVKLHFCYIVVWVSEHKRLHLSLPPDKRSSFSPSHFKSLTDLRYTYCPSSVPLTLLLLTIGSVCWILIILWHWHIACGPGRPSFSHAIPLRPLPHLPWTIFVHIHVTTRTKIIVDDGASYFRGSVEKTYLYK
jgi:hypothetical protein